MLVKIVGITFKNILLLYEVQSKSSRNLFLETASVDAGGNYAA